MNPSDYFMEGSEGYLQTKQAIETINAGRAAGLPNMDQYQRELEASIKIAVNSGGKDWKGFDANRQAIAGIVPQIQEKGKSAESVNKLKTAVELFQTSGGKLPDNQVRAIVEAAEIGNKEKLDAYADQLSKLTETLIERTLPKTPEEEAKEKLDALNLEAAQKKAEAEEQAAANSKASFEETLKEKYKAIVAIKNDPSIKSAFGTPIQRLVPGSAASSLSAKVEQLSSEEWIDAIIKAKSSGAAFGSLTENEGAKLAVAATLLSKPAALNYETANAELQKMAESVKKLYKKSSGRDLKEEVKKETQPEKQAQINKENQSKLDKFRTSTPQ